MDSTRADMTRRVSNTGTDNTASVNGMSPNPLAAKTAPNDRASRVWMTKIDMTNPMTSVPPSPMNIRELLPKTLWKKNGIKAPTQTMASRTMTRSPAKKKKVPKIRHAIMQ